MNDLTRALEEMARQAGGAAGAAPVAAVLGRRRRRRLVRRSVVTAGSVAAATAIVLTGTTFMDRQDPPVPPATEEPAPEPTPSPTSEPPPAPEPTPDAVVLPEGDPSLPWGVCGSVVGAAPAEPRAEEMLVSFRTDEQTVTVGSPVGWHTLHLPTTPEEQADGTWAGGGDESFGMADAGPGLVVTADGVVVARAEFDAGAEGYRLYWASVRHSRASTFEVCAAEGQNQVTAGAPLPPGGYEVRTTTRVWDVSVDDALALTAEPGDDTIALDVLESLAPAALVVSEPVPLTVVEGDAGPWPTARPAGLREHGPDLPACGEVLETWADDGVFVLDHPTAPLSVATGQGLTLRADLRYQGDGVLYAGHQQGVSGLLVTDLEGRVVGSGYVWNTGHWSEPFHVGPGGSLALAQPAETVDDPGSYVLRGCPPGRPDDGFWSDTDPLGPGSYRAHVFHEGDDGVHLRHPDGSVTTGRQDPSSDWVTLIGPAVELTIE